MRSDRPLPGEYKEIARGSGPAAILLFLHIAVVGYLGFTMTMLLKYNQEIFWNLTPFSAWLYYYFPAAFAVMTYIPSDGLTRGVARVAMGVGVVSWIVYGFGWAMILSGKADVVGGAGVQSVAALAAGCAGGLLLRLAFLAGIRRGLQEK